MRDVQSGKVIAVDGNGADISLVPFDRNIAANYSHLEGTEFGPDRSDVPRAGGFLHTLMATSK